MKLRVLGNSLRLRLTRSEVASVSAGDSVETRTSFGGPTDLVYRVRASAELTEARAKFSEGVVEVELPGAEAEGWADSDRVGFDARQSLDGDEDLRILVEKDFKCLAPREDEDQSDAFANPSLTGHE